MPCSFSNVQADLLKLCESKDCSPLKIVPSMHNLGAIDPCAGDGSALLEITNGTGAHLAAIEVDADRAVAAARRGIPTVHGSAFECKVESESCSLLYLNPHYETDLGRHGNK